MWWCWIKYSLEKIERTNVIIMELINIPLRHASFKWEINSSLSDKHSRICVIFINRIGALFVEKIKMYTFTLLFLSKTPPFLEAWTFNPFNLSIERLVKKTLPVYFCRWHLSLISQMSFNKIKYHLRLDNIEDVE